MFDLNKYKSVQPVDLQNYIIDPYYYNTNDLKIQKALLDWICSSKGVGLREAKEMAIKYLQKGEKLFFNRKSRDLHATIRTECDYWRYVGSDEKSENAVLKLWREVMAEVLSITYNEATQIIIN